VSHFPLQHLMRTLFAVVNVSEFGVHICMLVRVNCMSLLHGFNHG
jgi:hypothetical protein